MHICSRKCTVDKYLVVMIVSLILKVVHLQNIVWAVPVVDISSQTLSLRHKVT